MIGRVSSPRFVGRRAELEVLQDAVARAGEGAGSVVLVGAEAGMGKSRLIAELHDRARADGATVLLGECLPLGGGELPYAPIVGVLRQLLREHGAERLSVLAGAGETELVRLLPELAARPPERELSISGASPGRLFEQLLALLTGAAWERPVVLVIEDLQWCDRSTRDFLTFLARGIRRERLALILTYRSDELQRNHPARPFLVELERSGQGRRLELTRFGAEELREQVGEILGHAPAPALIGSLLRRAEGNPFFTEELLAGAEEPDAALPESLREAILLRVEGRGPAVGAVLRVAAVAGREVDHPLLEAVAGLPGEQLLTALREAVQSYLLVQQPGSAGYAFRHALLREAVAGDLLPGERSALHLRLAKAIEASLTTPAARAAVISELAHHWHAAGRLPEALATAIEAGVHAEDLRALGEALAHYARALALWDAVEPAEPALSRLEVLRRAADAADLTGDTDRAIALGSEVRDRVNPADPVAAALAHERMGHYLWSAGRAREALAAFRRAVELMPETACRERALVLAAEGRMLMLSNYTAESGQRCAAALRIAAAVGAPEIEAAALNTTAANLSDRGEFAAAVEHARRALAIARRLGLAGELGRAYVNGSDALDEAGRVGESIALTREGIEAARAYGTDRGYGDFLRAELGGRLWRSGDWDGAEALLTELSERSAPGVNAYHVLQLLGLLRAERGEIDAAAAAVAGSEANVEGASGSWHLGPLAAAQATIELWSGEFAAAAATADACLAGMSRGEFVFLTGRVYELGVRAHVELALAAGDDAAERERHAGAARAVLDRLDVEIAKLVTAQPRVLAGRAAAHAELGRLTGSDPEAWAAAEQRSAAIGDIHQVAYTRWRRAEALLQAGGDRRRIQDLLRQAHLTAAGLRARPLREAIEATARLARMELEPGGAPAATELQRFELTPRELEVLALLGEGMSNREIAGALVISDKTASVHVSRILAKLSVPNRSSAAVLAQRLGVVVAHRG